MTKNENEISKSTIACANYIFPFFCHRPKAKKAKEKEEEEAEERMNEVVVLGAVAVMSFTFSLSPSVAFCRRALFTLSNVSNDERKILPTKWTFFRSNSSISLWLGFALVNYAIAIRPSLARSRASLALLRRRNRRKSRESGGRSGRRWQIKNDKSGKKAAARERRRGSGMTQSKAALRAKTKGNSNRVG